MTLRGGDVDGDGGGIFVPSRQLTLDLDHVSIGPNQADASGGGLWLAGDAPAFPAIVTIRDSTISGNSTMGDGGGIYAFNSTVTVQRSLISDNFASNYGDGIVNYGDGTVRDSTIAGNGFGAVGDLGGGIFSQSATTLENVTMFDNEGGASADTGAHIYQNGGTLTVRNVLLGVAAFGGECSNIGSGTYIAQGTNLVESPGVCDDFTASSNLGLGTLGDEGGPTETVPVTASSDARGAADDAFCGSTDQRGVPRPDGGCDVGAYQFATCFGVQVNRVGTPGVDSLVGDPLDPSESFLMLGGNDTVRAKGGKDQACGGSGKDKLFGGQGRDNLDGGPAVDLCDGQGGQDTAKACEKQRNIP
ncbi:MAG: choice-of-anchor Q domain-containing protein [Actinomycetota bacterium]